MPRTLIKSRLHSNKHKPKIKQEVNNTNSNLSLHLQSFKQKLLSGNGFLKYNQFYKSWLLQNLSTTEVYYEQYRSEWWLY